MLVLICDDRIVIFHDVRSKDENPELASQLRPAALIMSRVISHPSKDRLTVDAGSKAIAAEVGNPIAVAIGNPDLIADTPSEEHLPFAVPQKALASFPRGHALYLWPTHICPSVNLASEALLVESCDAASSLTYSAVSVKARGHDLILDGPGRSNGNLN